MKTMRLIGVNNRLSCKYLWKEWQTVLNLIGRSLLAFSNLGTCMHFAQHSSGRIFILAGTQRWNNVDSRYVESTLFRRCVPAGYTSYGRTVSLNPYHVDYAGHLKNDAR